MDGWMDRLMMNEKIIDKRREDLFLIRKGFIFRHLTWHPAKNVHFINRFLSPSRWGFSNFSWIKALPALPCTSLRSLRYYKHTDFINEKVLKEGDYEKELAWVRVFPYFLTSWLCHQSDTAFLINACWGESISGKLEVIISEAPFPFRNIIPSHY